MKIRTYSELIRFSTFEDRLNYLKLDGAVGVSTFGFNRYLNQTFYHSKEWKAVCREIIIRDNACDLAHPDFPIFDHVYVHHMNPLTEIDIIERNVTALLEPEFLICTSFNSHNLIHFGLNHPSSLSLERKKNDTCPWK